MFATLVRRLPAFDYDPGRSFRAWLKTVMLNAWRNRLRSAPPPGLALADVAAAEEGCEFEEAEYRQMLVSRALSLLRADFEPATWKAFWECVAAGRPGPEVAVELGLSPGAVRSAKFRVLARLRQELNGLLEE